MGYSMFLNPGKGPEEIYRRSGGLHGEIDGSVVEALFGRGEGMGYSMFLNLGKEPRGDL
jgi:hypothetical protein